MPEVEGAPGGGRSLPQLVGAAITLAVLIGAVVIAFEVVSFITGLVWLVVKVVLAVLVVGFVLRLLARRL